jgi:pimeloyl-ACP methyl ester carboxylesterase
MARVPTLVIHGSDDPGPVEAGKDTARRIPDPKLQIVPGMGHDFANKLVPILVEAIAEHCRTANASLRGRVSLRGHSRA